MHAPTALAKPVAHPFRLFANATRPHWPVLPGAIGDGIDPHCARPLQAFAHSRLHDDHEAGRNKSLNRSSQRKQRISERVSLCSFCELQFKTFLFLAPNELAGLPVSQTLPRKSGRLFGSKIVMLTIVPKRNLGHAETEWSGRSDDFARGARHNVSGQRDARCQRNIQLDLLPRDAAVPGLRRHGPILRNAVREKGLEIGKTFVPGMWHFGLGDSRQDRVHIGRRAPARIDSQNN